MNHIINISGLVRLVLLGIATMSLVACANQRSIFRTAGLAGGGHAMITDAKQRVITNTSAGKNEIFHGRNQPNFIVCAEPSPDVAEALSVALSLGGQSGSSSGSASFATAASVAQLGERLATVQLLRDELADLCRSYANGAISTTTYTLRLSTLDRKMVTLLMAEMTAGAFGRQLASLGGQSSSATGRVGTDQEIEAARSELELRRAELKELEGSKLKADADAVDTNKNPKEEGTAAETSNGLAKEIVAKEKEIESHETHLNALLRPISSAFASGKTTGGIGQIQGARTTNTATALVTLQQNFLDEDHLGTLMAACVSSLDARIGGDETGNRGTAKIAAANVDEIRVKILGLRNQIEASIGQAQLPELQKDLAVAEFEEAEALNKLSQELGTQGLTKFGAWCLAELKDIRTKIGTLATEKAKAATVAARTRLEEALVTECFAVLNKEKESGNEDLFEACNNKVVDALKVPDETDS